MKYLVTLENKETREIKILNKPVFACFFEYNGDGYFFTFKEIKEKHIKSIVSIRYDKPYYLFLDNVGYIKGEGFLFDIFRNLKNPIIKLKRIK